MKKILKRQKRLEDLLNKIFKIIDKISKEQLIKSCNCSNIRLKKIALEEYFGNLIPDTLIPMMPPEFTETMDVSLFTDSFDYCEKFDLWLEKLENDELISELFKKYKRFFTGHALKLSNEIKD